MTQLIETDDIKHFGNAKLAQEMIDHLEALEYGVKQQNNKLAVFYGFKQIAKVDLSLPNRIDTTKGVNNEVFEILTDFAKGLRKAGVEDE